MIIVRPGKVKVDETQVFFKDQPATVDYSNLGKVLSYFDVSHQAPPWQASKAERVNIGLLVALAMNDYTCATSAQGKLNTQTPHLLPIM